MKRKTNHYINTLNERKTADLILSAVFIIAELILYLIFMCLDFASSVDSTAFKYVAICLCLVFSLYRSFKKGLDGVILLGALFFTVLSDTFTLVINDYFVLGVTFFIPAQLLYALRMRFWSKKSAYKSIIARISVILTAIVVLWIFNSLEPLTAVTAVYFSMLIYNAIESVYFAKTPSQIIFCIGLWLFICCDICVGLYNISSVFEVTLSPKFDYTVGVLMWGFYLPSQVLIVLSSNKNLINTVDQFKFK